MSSFSCEKLVKYILHEYERMHYSHLVNDDFSFKWWMEKKINSLDSQNQHKEKKKTPEFSE